MHIRTIMKKNPITQETLWSGIQLAKLAPSRRHHFIPKLLDEYVGRGFATITDKKIILHTIDGDMPFKLDHVPGRYCCHCNEALLNEDLEEGGAAIPQGDPRLGAAARVHVAANHEGEVSPDRNNPSGYKYKMYYGATAEDSVPTINPNAPQL